MGLFSSKFKIARLDDNIDRLKNEMQNLKLKVVGLEAKIDKLSRIDLLINSQELKAEINQIIDYCIKTKIINQDLLKDIPKNSRK